MPQLTRTFWMIALSTLICLGVASSALADRKADLQARFKQRFAALEKLREDGKVGETYEGFAEAFKDSLEKKSADLVADENADRKELYKIIAEEEKTTPEMVGTKNAERLYKRAKPGYWFKHRNGEWKKK